MGQSYFVERGCYRSSWNLTTGGIPVDEPGDLWSPCGPSAHPTRHPLITPDVGTDKSTFAWIFARVGVCHLQLLL